jgi:hypothetical protein
MSKNSAQLDRVRRLEEEFEGRLEQRSACRLAHAYETTGSPQLRSTLQPELFWRHTMDFPDFFDKAPSVALRDPLAKFLGASRSSVITYRRREA